MTRESDGAEPRRAAKGLAAVGMALCLAGCGSNTPKGQVVANVNGQEVTYQDLAAQARIDGTVGRADPRLLLQKVVGRVLLFQNAKSRGLDRYRGYPADLAAVQQDFLARKLLRTVLKTPAPPSSGQLAGFIALHPYLFGSRQKVKLDEVVIHGPLDRKALQDPDSLDALQRKLNALNVTFDRQQATVDTADLPAPLAQRLATVANGALTFVDQPQQTTVFVVLDRQPVNMPSDQQAALATRLYTQTQSQAEVNGLVQSLQKTAKISYQKGFAPPPPTAPPAPAS